MALGRAVFLSLALLVCVGCGREGGPASAAQGEESVVVRQARGVVNDIVAGRYAEVRLLFDERMAGALPELELASGWMEFERIFGTFLSQEDAETLQRGPYTVVNIKLVMPSEKARLA